MSINENNNNEADENAEALALIFGEALKKKSSQRKIAKKIGCSTGAVGKLKNENMWRGNWSRNLPSPQFVALVATEAGLDEKALKNMAAAQREFLGLPPAKAPALRRRKKGNRSDVSTVSTRQLYQLEAKSRTLSAALGVSFAIGLLLWSISLVR